MKKLFLFLIALIVISKLSLAQNLNLIIRVNEKILIGEISNLKVKIGNENFSALYYYPGDLELSKEAWKIINSDTLSEMIVSFDYNTFENDKHKISQFKIQLSNSKIKLPYVIADIFDFRNKKYKKWYGHLTKENYIVQTICYGCGLYVKQK